MNDQRLQQIERALKDKASQFDASREKSKRQIKDSMQTLRDQINTVEADLLRKIDRVFEENAFAAAISEINDCHRRAPSSVNYDKLERVSREPVPPVTGPSESDFFEVQKAILNLKSLEGKKVEQRITGNATSFDAIALSWDNVPGAATY